LDKLIKRDWRNWKPQSIPSKRPSSQQTEGLPAVGAGGIDTAIKNIHSIPKVAQAKKAIKPKKFKKVALPKIPIRKSPKINQMKQNKTYAEISNNRLDYFDDEKRWTQDFKEKIIRINKEESHNTFKSAIESKDKRLSNSFARMISKYAEDHIGEPTIGEDEWDMNELMMRGITKRNIYSCMQSKEKLNIALVLDSSPSCHRQSILYHKIAALANKLGSVDIYLAPNARLTHQFNSRINDYEPMFEDNNGIRVDDIVLKLNHMQNYFKNRVIFFFGDYDGTSILRKCSENNTIHWFNQDYDADDDYPDYRRGFQGELYRCANRKDLINITKRIR